MHTITQDICPTTTITIINSSISLPAFGAGVF
jgi:hypothetical protein